MPHLSSSTIDAIRPAILKILHKSDLASVSAKKVRVQLKSLEDPQSPGQTLLAKLQIRLSDADQKEDIDNLIRDCYDQVSQEQAHRDDEMPLSQRQASASTGGMVLPTGNGHGPAPGSQSNGNGGSSAATAPAAPKLALPGMGGIPGSHATARAPPASKASTSSSTTSSSAPKRRKADDVISDEEADADVSRLPSKSKSSSSGSKKRKSNGAATADGEPKATNPNNPFNRPVVLSDAMSQLCGAKEMPRYMITKNLWQYIKARDLQNPQNKRQILCDDTLQKLFGKPVVDSFEMAKLISPHVTKKDVA